VTPNDALALPPWTAAWGHAAYNIASCIRWVVGPLPSAGAGLNGGSVKMRRVLSNRRFSGNNQTMGRNHLNVDSIDWSTWKPTEYATLCFIMRDGQILLIRKKRGLGAGKINGPGGRIEKGETALASAIRETQEEIGVTPKDVEEIGKLLFEFRDGYKLDVAVFAASGLEGELRETPEATPFWVAIDGIPYEEMWQDDPHWLPLLLARKKFRGCFIFDGETLLSHRIEVHGS
jgi:8-oxo-dGTP diphosphatase